MHYNGGMGQQRQDTLAFVRNGLMARRAKPGWRFVADATGIHYSTLWRIAYQKRDSRMSTVGALADWLRANPKR